MKIFPTKQQWDDWTLPSKASYISVWLGIVALLPFLFSISSKHLPAPEMIRQLGERAEWNNSYGGDRQSYLTLISWEQTINESQLKKLISSEIEKLKDQYRNSATSLIVEQLPAICVFITKPNVEPCSEGREPSRGFSAKNVLDHLDRNKYSYWTERARAAYLLRHIDTSPNKDSVRIQDVYEWLIKVMKEENENSLLVSKMALDTYASLTNYELKQVFDFEGAIKDWEQKKIKEYSTTKY